MLEGKVAIITGAARGIGKTIAIKYAEHGSNVALTDVVLNEESDALEKELQAMGVKAKIYKSDAADFSGSAELMEQIVNDFGTVDILVNNAGITRDNLLLRMTEDDWDLVLKVNLKSCFNMIKAVQPIMLKKKAGSIINMSSVVGRKGNAGQVNYSASKAGMIGLTKSVALELGSRNVRSNAIAPGFIETEMTAKLDEEVIKQWYRAIPLRRGGTPEDVANAALFLASDFSSYITGQVLSVDGGMYT